MLPKLRELHLSTISMDSANNTLSELEVGVTCEMLDMLILCSNLFVDMRRLIIDKLINLRHLDLSGNKIKEISFKWFRFSCLEFLDLKNNSIESLSLLAEARMPNLFELNLGKATVNTENNNIRRIDFTGVLMHRLSMLNLSKNVIELVEGLDQASLTNLEIFNLADNNLLSIDFTCCRIPNI